MALSNQLANQHLLWRAGFGPAVGQLAQLPKTNPLKLYKSLVKDSEGEPAYIDVADDYLQAIVMGKVKEGEMAPAAPMTPEDRKLLNKKHKDSETVLNVTWMKEMVNSKAQLREKMALFWHGHFACRTANVFFEQALLHTLRKNALGNFGVMLKEVARSAGMLNFLNNQQNRKGTPNENFAREVMELFTIGRGNYSENDVKEAARAFTGWTATTRGVFTFRNNLHDFGSKTFMGKTANFDGDDIMDIILGQRETAVFICSKLYTYLVNPVPDKQHIGQMADKFYQSGYEISSLLDFVFTSQWFFDPKNVGVIIKSPVDLIVGIQRMVPMKLDDDKAIVTFQQLLGQTLFLPPNVAGWPGGRTWIDSSTLMVRLRVPQLFNDQDELNVVPKADDDKMMGKKDDGTPNLTPKADKPKATGKGVKPIDVTLDWKENISHFSKVPRPELLNSIASFLLQSKRAVTDSVIIDSSDSSTKESFIKSATIQLMSTPDYQLC